MNVNDRNTGENNMPKNYYQYRNAYRLHPSTMKYITWKVLQYPMFLEEIKRIDAKNILKITKKDIENKAAMEEQINLIDSCLEKYVSEDKRQAVKEHCCFGIEYEILESKYQWEMTAIKKAAQKFIWGVAQECGEDYRS